MSSIVVPCICILFCYFRIFYYVRKSKAKITAKLAKQTAKSTNAEMKKSIRIAKGLFASFMLFTLCWLPYGIIVMSDYHDQLPRTAHMFSMLLAHLNSSLNPLLYAIFNPGFQRGYLTFFRVLILRKAPPKGEKASKTYNTTARPSEGTIRNQVMNELYNVK
jgi:hypothetical protein